MAEPITGVPLDQVGTPKTQDKNTPVIQTGPDLTNLTNLSDGERQALFGGYAMPKPESGDEVSTSDSNPEVDQPENAPDKFSEAYRKLQSERDQAQHQIQMMMQQQQMLQQQLQSNQDLAVLRQQLEKSPELAEQFFTAVKQSADPTSAIEAPKPPDPSEYDMLDPDKQRKWIEDSTAYSQALADYKSKLFEAKQQQQLAPIQQFLQSQQQQAQMQQEYARLYNAAIAEGIPPQEAEAMTNWAFNKPHLEARDYYNLYRASVVPPAGYQPQSQPQPAQAPPTPGQVLAQPTNTQRSMAHQRALQQQFPVPPSATQSSRVDPRQATVDRVVDAANQQFAPLLRVQ